MNQSTLTFLTLIIFGSTLACSIVLAGLTNKHEHYVLYFKNSRTGKEVTESRYIKKQHIKTKEESVVQEILLGPTNHDFYQYVDSKTSYKTCFLENGQLNINFSKDIIHQVETNMRFSEFYALFTKNIITNCPNVKSIQLYIDGILAYDSF